MNILTSLTLDLPLWTLDFLKHSPSIFHSDEKKMEFVLELTRQNILKQTGGPFGAAIFELTTGRLISIGVNRVVDQHSSSAHAEMMAIMLAQKTLKTFDLSNHGQFQMVTSSQMCVMCLGGVIWSGLKEVIYSTSTQDVEQMIGFDEGPCPLNYKQELAQRGVILKGPFKQEQGKEVLKLYVDQGGIVYNSSSNTKPWKR